jgi:hypothetical protein
MKDHIHSGEDTRGNAWRVKITRGVTFRAYNISGFEKFEATVEDGVITHQLPDELDEHQARAFAAILMDAADELERSK